MTHNAFTLETALQLASLDLETANVDAALVGVVCEVGENLDAHRGALQLPDHLSLAEGSHWLYVGHDTQAKEIEAKGYSSAIAKIQSIKMPIKADNLQAYLQQLIDICR